MIDKEYKGYIVVSDELKIDRIKTIKKLKGFGIKTIAMLTGDNKQISQKTATELNLTHVYGELLPEDKVKILTQIKENKDSGYTIFVGDGINDGAFLLQVILVYQ